MLAHFGLFFPAAHYNPAALEFINFECIEGQTILVTSGVTRKQTISKALVERLAN